VCFLRAMCGRFPGAFAMPVLRRRLRLARATVATMAPTLKWRPDAGLRRGLDCWLGCRWKPEANAISVERCDPTPLALVAWPLRINRVIDFHAWRHRRSTRV
jgi:hypothetical protein